MKSGTTAQELVDEIEIKGLTKWLMNRYLSTFAYFYMKESLKEVSENVQNITIRNKKRSFESFYLKINESELNGFIFSNEGCRRKENKFSKIKKTVKILFIHSFS